MPPTVKETFRWCSYFGSANPYIAPAIHKIAVFPITDLIYEDDDEPEVRALKEIFDDQIDIKGVIYNTRLDLCCFGNSFSSIRFPKMKWLSCPYCSKESPIEAVEDWKYKNFTFVGTCPLCKTVTEFTCKERAVRDTKDINIVRWAPSNIDIVHNPITGSCRFYYTIPAKMKRAVGAGDRDIIKETPLEYLRAIKEDKAIELDRDNIWHMKRATFAEQDQGWGASPILPAMKTAFQTQILRKANEAIAIQYIKPWTILFPQPTKDINIQTDVDLASWQTWLGQEILRHRDDENRVSSAAFPVGQVQVYGNAKALMVTAELKASAEEIIIAMGYPPEFIWGGMQYSGSNISLRMIETQFIRDREQHRRQVNFYASRIQRFLGRKVISLRFSDLKMADDVQTKELMARMVMGQQLAMGPFLKELGKNPSENDKAIAKEMEFQNNLLMARSKAQALAQGEAQLIMSRYQIQSQKEQAEAQAKFQATQGIPMLQGAMMAQADQAQAALPPGPPPLQTNVTKSVQESTAQRQKQNTQAVTSGQAPTPQKAASPRFMQRLADRLWSQNVDLGKLAFDTAATLFNKSHADRQESFRKIKDPKMQMIVGNQLARMNLSKQTPWAIGKPDERTRMAA